MKALIHFFVLSCLKATLLIEKRNVLPLSFIQRIQLKLHLRICDKCTTYEKQSVLIDTLLKNRLKREDISVNNSLSLNVKSKINKEIQEKLKK